MAKPGDPYAPTCFGIYIAHKRFHNFLSQKKYMWWWILYIFVRKKSNCQGVWNTPLNYKTRYPPPPSTSKTGQLTPWLVFKVVWAVDPTCQPHLSLSLPFLSPSLLSLSPLSSARAVELCHPHIELLTSGIGFVRLLLSACTMQMLIRLG